MAPRHVSEAPAAGTFYNPQQIPDRNVECSAYDRRPQSGTALQITENESQRISQSTAYTDDDEGYTGRLPLSQLQQPTTIPYSSIESYPSVREGTDAIRPPGPRVPVKVPDAEAKKTGISSLEKYNIVDTESFRKETSRLVKEMREKGLPDREIQERLIVRQTERTKQIRKTPERKERENLQQRRREVYKKYTAASPPSKGNDDSEASRRTRRNRCQRRYRLNQVRAKEKKRPLSDEEFDEHEAAERMKKDQRAAALLYSSNNDEESERPSNSRRRGTDGSPGLGYDYFEKQSIMQSTLPNPPRAAAKSVLESRAPNCYHINGAPPEHPMSMISNMNVPCQNPSGAANQSALDDYPPDCYQISPTPSELSRNETSNTDVARQHRPRTADVTHMVHRSGLPCIHYYPEGQGQEREDYHSVYREPPQNQSGSPSTRSNRESGSSRHPPRFHF